MTAPPSGSRSPAFPRITSPYISGRTLWGYCSSEEGRVQPLPAHGISVVVERLRTWPRDVPLIEVFLHENDLTEGIPESTSDLARLIRPEPSRRSVRRRSHLDAERASA
ncbi:hypothetical protein [Streptomyces scabichelini]|uniref:hypothetical protein n=1 Tax=Streptomyces scabichelini TaxID=2711217 RepID=UPI0019D117B8|nr:hypothetical protein [Streptomyces scabichelini]